MIGEEGGTDGLDDGFFESRDTDVGATIMGRNMFGPIRGPWGQSDWTGWWGDDPPFHSPVFVLTHHPRPPMEMQGGTTFHFVDDGIDAALAAAPSKRRAIAMFWSVARRVHHPAVFLAGALIDDMQLAMVPVLLGSGERLFENLGPSIGDYKCVEHVCSPAVTHVRFARSR